MFLSGGTYYHITYLISANKMSRKGKSVFNSFFLVTYYMLNIKCPTSFLFVLPSYGIGAYSPEATNRHKGKWKIGVTQFFLPMRWLNLFVSSQRCISLRWKVFGEEVWLRVLMWVNGSLSSKWTCFWESLDIPEKRKARKQLLGQILCTTLVSIEQRSGCMYNFTHCGYQTHIFIQ